jgi:moderate conductance mechanosensitive channel
MNLFADLPFDLPSTEFFFAMGGRLTRALLIIFAAAIVIRILRRIIRGFAERVRHAFETDEANSRVEREKRVQTLSRVLKLTVSIVIWGVALAMSLRELGFDIAPLLAGAGVVGLAVGFGAQNLVRDVITGLFLLLENQVRVGDVAVINGQGGLVEEVNLRTIVLRDLEGMVHIFPNGTITTLSNRTRGFSAFVLDLGVAYKEDTDRVVELLRRISDEMLADPEIGPSMLDGLEIFGVDKFADSAVMIKGRVRTRPGDQWKVGRNLNRRIKKLFDEEGVEIPFPHHTLYMGEASKPFDLQLSGGLSDETEERIRRIVREEVERSRTGSGAE